MSASRDPHARWRSRDIETGMFFLAKEEESLPSIYTATNPLMNLCLSFLEIGEAIAPLWVWSWGHSVGRQSPMVTRVLLCPGGSGDRVLDVGFGIAASCLSESWSTGKRITQPQDDEKSQVKEFKRQDLQN